MSPLLLAAVAEAQCNTGWLPGDGVPGTDQPATTAVMWDADGAGPLPAQVVIGGVFTTAGNIATLGIAAWDPATGTWSPLGNTGGAVSALAVAPNGELIAAASSGGPDRVMRWTGSAWATIPGNFNGIITCLAVLPDSTIVAGGNFTSVNAVAAGGIARWNGTWSSFGTGTDGAAHALLVAANGDLLVGGTYSQIGGTAANCLARWNGTTWSAFGTGVPPLGLGGIYALAELSGGDIVAGGFFPSAGGVPANNIARWNGSVWSPLGNGVNASPNLSGSVRSLLLLPNGNLVVGGIFSAASGVTARSIARWAGTAWTALGPGFQPLSVFQNAEVADLVLLPNGEVVAVGSFRSAGGQLGDGVSRWDGVAWRALAPGFNNIVRCIAAGTADRVVVGGEFTIAGGVVANRVASWNGASWAAMGTGTNGTVHTALVLPNGHVIVGGEFTTAGGIAASRIARWNGTTWSAMGAGMNSPVYSLETMPDGSVVAGGSFTTAGGVACNFIARWNGATWSPLGSGVSGSIAAMHVRPDGTLVVGGSFSSAGGVTVNNLAVWNGTSWSGLGSLLAPTAFATLSNGDLVAASGSAVARWDGTTWTSLGAAADNWVFALAALPNGHLVATGNFTWIGNVQASRIARWNGSNWAPFGAGVNLPGIALAVLPQGELAVGGMQTLAGGAPSAHFARLGSTCPVGIAALGPGCPSWGGSNSLGVTAPAWSGGSLRTRSLGVPAIGFVAAVTGFTTTSLSLATLFAEGQPGCVLYPSPDLLALAVPVAGVTSASLAIPNSAPLIGQTFHHQHVPFEFTAAGTLVAVTSTNALSVTIGAF